MKNMLKKFTVYTSSIKTSYEAKKNLIITFDTDISRKSERELNERD